jgi:hypothetical protein
MSSESIQFRTDISNLIGELGEMMTFSRAGKVFAKAKGTFNTIFEKNIDPGNPSPLASQQRTVTIQWSQKYVPELFDTVQDTHKNIFSVNDIDTVRFQDTVICYTLTIT